MFRSLIASVLAFGLSLTSSQAGESPVVVELYTSQGCSSCPPADRFLHELAARDDVIALALHVDYWDYIGWVDRFADPAHARRQHAYRRAWNERMVYTPQMVVQGRDGVVGNNPAEVNALIAKHGAAPDVIDLRVARKDGQVVIEAEAIRAVPGILDVMVARFEPERTIEITRGENAGRTLSYANVVTELRDVGDWSGESPMRLAVDPAGKGSLAVFLQRKGMGGIEAAAILR